MANPKPKTKKKREKRTGVNGVAHVRSCQTLCENGMDVRTDE